MSKFREAFTDEHGNMLCIFCGSDEFEKVEAFSPFGKGGAYKCLKCGHDKFFHERKVADYNDKKIGECTAEMGDEGEEYYCHCKKFKPVQSPETKPRVYIERAEPLTREGIKAICMSDEDYKKYRKDKTPDALRGCGKDFDYYKKFKWTCGIDGILCLSCQKKQENYNGR